MFLKSEHLSFPSSYFLILDSIVQKYLGESGGESRPGRGSRSAPGRAPLSPELPQPQPGLLLRGHRRPVRIPGALISPTRGHLTPKAFHLLLSPSAGAMTSGTPVVLVEAGVDHDSCRPVSPKPLAG